VNLKASTATGNKVTFTAMDIDKISNGKFVECWTHMDELGLMQQLGCYTKAINRRKGTRTIFCRSAFSLFNFFRKDTWNEKDADFFGR
jgi:hypothetical protein